MVPDFPLIRGPAFRKARNEAANDPAFTLAV